MNNPTPYCLLFIVFIGLVYILSTCQWESPSEQTDPTDDSHETDSNDDGNSESNIPQVSKALATADQSTSATNYNGEALTLQCPNEIEKITSARYKYRKDYITDITQEVNDNCKGNTVCTVQTSWDHTNVWLHVAASGSLDIDDGNHFKKIITDPYHGRAKHLDISYSCESDQAKSKFIIAGAEDEDNTISCASAAPKVIKVESAWLKSRNHKEPMEDVLTHLNLDICDGRETCIIKPVTYNNNGKNRYSFAIKDVTRCEITTKTGVVQATELFDACNGLYDPGYEDEMELAIVYYCVAKQVKNIVLNGPGEFRCVLGQKIQLESARLRDASRNSYDDVLSQFQACNGQIGCQLHEPPPAGHQLFIDYYCIQ